MPDHDLALIAVSVGNTNTHVGRFEAEKIAARLTLPGADAPAIADAIAALAGEFEADGRRRAVVIATVNPQASSRIEHALKDRLGGAGWGVYLVGRDLDVPMQGRLDPEAMTGQDRVLAALAAFETMKQACVVVDAGTAITVDFVDGEGVFQGGAIAPGVRMSLRALHQHTAALPDLEFATPDPGIVFGRNTAQAMANGVYYGARGLVRMLVERYAEAYDAYPPVIATGGDAHALFDDDELVDRVVDDLVLRGIALACRKALAPTRAEDDDDREG